MKPNILLILLFSLNHLYSQNIDSFFTINSKICIKNIDENLSYFKNDSLIKVNKNYILGINTPIYIKIYNSKSLVITINHKDFNENFIFLKSNKNIENNILKINKLGVNKNNFYKKLLKAGNSEFHFDSAFNLIQYYKYQTNNSNYFNCWSTDLLEEGIAVDFQIPDVWYPTGEIKCSSVKNNLFIYYYTYSILGEIISIDIYEKKVDTNDYKYRSTLKGNANVTD